MKIFRIMGMFMTVLILSGMVLSTSAQTLAAPLTQSDDALTGVEGNSYTSPSFGYSVSWSRDWTVTNEVAEETENVLVLETDEAAVYFEGTALDLSNDDCITNLVEVLEGTEGVEDVVQMEDEGGELVGATEDDRSWAVFDFTFTLDDETLEITEYLDCRQIVEGESILVIRMITPTELFEDQIDPLVALLDELSIEGAPPTEDDETAGDTSDDTGAAEGELAEWVLVSARDIDSFWEREFPRISGGEQYEAPDAYVPFDTEVQTACGSAAVMEVGPFYCPPDRSVYYDLGFAEIQVDNFGNPSVISVVMAHEVGHHVQNLMQWDECEATPCLDPNQLTSQEFELQADCFAGAWVADAETRGRMGSFDIETNITQFALILGDQGIGNTADPGAHGKAASRVYWFLTGYFFGVDGCLTVSAATDPARNGGVTGSTTETEPSPEATVEPTAEATEEGIEAETFALGDEFTFELRDQSLTLTVSGTELTDSVAEDIVADGQYLVVYVTVERDAEAPGPLPYSGFIVTDSDGNEYRLDEVATDELLRTAFDDGIEENLDLGASYNIAFVFDVDPGASGFTFSSSTGEFLVELDA